MNIQQLKGKSGKIVDGPLLITPDIKKDERGYFFEAWNQKLFSLKINFFGDFNQDNISFSKKGTIRGLHYQIKPYAQNKLVSCLFGSIYDVAVDLRKESETFGDWIGVELNSENNYQFWIPEGFAHGFIVTSFESKVQYKVGGYWNREYERSLYWKDDDLNINWQLKNFDINEVIINSKDHNAATFQEIKNNGDIF